MATNPHVYIDENYGTNTGGSDTSFASQQTGAMSSLTASSVYDNVGSAVAGAAPSDGDIVYIADNHNAAYDNGGAYTLNGAGSRDSTGLTLISVDTTAIDEYKPGAIDALNDTADEIFFAANVALLGVTLSQGDNGIASFGSAANLRVVDGGLGSSGGNADYVLAIISDGSNIRFINSDINIASALADIGIVSNGGKFEWNGGALTGTAPNDLFNQPIGAAGSAEVIWTGVDLSIFTGTLFVTPASATQDRSLMRLTNCLLNSSVTPVGTLLRKNHRFEMFGCDDSTSNKLFRFLVEDGIGSAKNNETVYVTAGETWYEGTDHSSIQVDTKANCSHTIPFAFELPAQYINLGDTSTDTLTIDIVTAETLVKHDIAAFLVYPDGTTAVQPNWVSSGPSVGTGNYGIDPLDTSTTMPASALGAGDWTGEPGTPNFYELVLGTSSDVGQATAVSVRIEVYKASIGPIYIHPLITVSAT